MLRLQTVGSIRAIPDKRDPIWSRISFIVRLGPPLPSILLLKKKNNAKLSCCTDRPFTYYLDCLPPLPNTTTLFLHSFILENMAVLDRILIPPGSTGVVGLYLTNLAILVVLGLFGYYSASTYTSYRRLRHIPGPRTAGLSKWWMLRNTLGGSMHLALKEACETYGKRRLFTPRLQAPGSTFFI